MERGCSVLDIQKPAVAGTMESSDAYVRIQPGEGIDIQLESVVLAQFGDAILAVVHEVLDELDVRNASVHIVDRGALECVIRARVETAVKRGKEAI